MKILLDHNTPLGVRRALANHDVQPAGQMGWATLSNTNLLDAAERARFEIFITCDQNIAFQKNIATRRIAMRRPDDQSLGRHSRAAPNRAPRRR